MLFAAPLPVDDPAGVQELEGEQDFGRIKPCFLRAKPSSLDVEHQISSLDVLHDEEDISLQKLHRLRAYAVLKVGMQVHEEGVVLPGA